MVKYACNRTVLTILQEIVIHNDTPAPLNNVRLSFRSEPDIITGWEQNIDLIPSESVFSLRNPTLTANGEFLAGLTERICGVLYVTLMHGNDILAQETRELTALAFNEWHGTAFFPELLAAFVMPNHPEVVKLCAVRRRELLEK